MTFPVSLGPSRKRQEPDHYLDQPPPLSKRPKVDQPSPAYWDNLSKIWLTRDALKELDRRNRALSSNIEPSRSHHRHHRPLTRKLQERLKHRYEAPAPDPLVNCKPESLREIKRLSRQGGPDLSDIRNFPDPHIPFYQSMSTNTSRSRSRKRRAGSPADNSNNSNNKSTKTTSTTAYNRNFEQKLIDHGVYPPRYKYPDGQKPAKPDNWLEINDRLAQPRASLSPSKFSEHEFDEFVEADVNASKEKPVIRFAVPIIEGRVDDIRCMGGDYPFGNLAPLTDGTLANAKPDHFFGARPEQLNSEIRDELSDHIIPSTQSSLPMAPNFFLEAKGPDGSPAVATRQACYDGALGARGMQKLQSYKQEPVYDNNAYTITSTYQAGQLKLYTTHLTAPQESSRSEYIMTSLRSFAMTDNRDTFRKGASAYRNARDWAKEQRDELIKAANERHAQPQSETLSSEHGATSEQTVVLEDSDTSATPGSEKTS
ncbi:uncharacterized protein GIQ15_01984 [Arthroderma uncinatum]|uniref:uncharacterized protein n=1 Tax=Arthroderma uncinatum TaxID=74035 RepID=UPI00144A8A0B|nr:uncharacterized protein GIQ15_01984 [Arthroderma uncinatum]KAF3482660.1 hypothetical protein GIQ15_01984 [Arthroderma uncinatum]